MKQLYCLLIFSKMRKETSLKMCKQVSLKKSSSDIQFIPRVAAVSVINVCLKACDESVNI